MMYKNGNEELDEIGAQDLAGVIFIMLTNQEYTSKIMTGPPDEFFKAWARDRANNIATALKGMSVK